MGGGGGEGEGGELNDWGKSASFHIVKWRIQWFELTFTISTTINFIMVKFQGPTIFCPILII